MSGEWFSKISGKSREWYHNYIFFSKAVLFIFGLILCYSLVRHAALEIIMDYLIENWPKNKNRLPKVATTVNLLNGLSSVTAVIFAHIADSCIGHYKMVVISTCMYIMGLVVLWFSASENSKPRKPNFEFGYFYVPAVVMMLGESGLHSLLRAFLAHQLCEREPLNVNERQIEGRTNVWWRIAWFSGSVIAVFLLSSIKWKERFMVSAVSMGASLLLFFCGFKFYYHPRPTGSPLGMIFRVLKAALCKWNLRYPHRESDFYWQNAPRQYYRNHSGQILLLPKVTFLGWLDKAAIIVETSSINPQKLEINPGVEEVTDVKRLLTLIPIWTTLFVFSLVEATGNTFFIEQRNNLKDIGNKLNVEDSTIVSFFVLKSFLRFIIPLLSWSRKAKHVTRVKIGFGLVCSILCCIAAWQVEVHRLKESKNLDRNKTISMSILCLLPQFILLGLTEGFGDEGLEEFFDSHVKTKSMKSYGPLFTECILGFGNFFSIPFVLLIKSWFKSTINKSQLDKYFLALAILGSVFFCLYVYVSSMYASMEVPSEDVELTDALPTTTRSYLRWSTWPVRAATCRHYSRLENELDASLQSPPHVHNRESVDKLSFQSGSSNEDEEFCCL